MDTPWLSIIVPVYQVEAYLPACMESIRVQNDPAIEIILVDDGSPDGCPQLCDAYAREDPCVRVIHKKNGGVSSARNAGLRAARGTWIICLDPDDWWEPGLLEAARTLLQESETDLLIFSYFHEENGVSTRCRMGLPEHTVHGGKALLEKLQLGILDENHRFVKSYIGAPWMQFVRRSLITERDLFFDETLRQSEDSLWNLNLLEQASDVTLLNEAFYHYRIHGASCFHRYDPELPAQIEQINRKFRAFGETQHKGAAYREAYAFWLMKKYLQLLKLYFFHPDCPKTGRENQQDWENLFETCPSLQELRNMKLRTLWDGRKIYTLFYLTRFVCPSYRMTKALYGSLKRMGKI